jgi:hypothetical protein
MRYSPSKKLRIDMIAIPMGGLIEIILIDKYYQKRKRLYKTASF